MKTVTYKYKSTIFNEINGQTPDYDRPFSNKELIDMALWKVSQEGFNKNIIEHKTIKNFTFIDLFAGIGGNRIAFEKFNGQCVFSSEIDRWCAKTYFYNFLELPESNITKIESNDIPKHDILLDYYTTTRGSSLVH